MMSACGSNKLTSFSPAGTAPEYPALALADDAGNQRQIMIDRGAPPLGHHSGDLGHTGSDRLQLGTGRLGGRDQLAIKLTFLALAPAVVDLSRPLLGQTLAIAPPRHRRFRQPPGPAQLPRHDPHRIP